MDKTKTGTVCFIVGAICFGIVAFGNFYKGDPVLGAISLLAATMDVISAIMIGKNRESKP